MVQLLKIKLRRISARKEAGCQAEQFALIHLSRAVGKRLKNRTLNYEIHQTH